MLITMTRYWVWLLGDVIKWLLFKQIIQGSVWIIDSDGWNVWFLSIKCHCCWKTVLYFSTMTWWGCCFLIIKSHRFNISKDSVHTNSLSLIYSDNNMWFKYVNATWYFFSKYNWYFDMLSYILWCKHLTESDYAWAANG